jgi:hypothetical protein
MSISFPTNGQSSNAGASFPRTLSNFERATLLWLLPEHKPGYQQYRRRVNTWKVIGKGRRGEGNFILAPEPGAPDNSAPLAQVFAYGVIETSAGKISATLREAEEGQLEFEIVNLDSETIPESFEERRRWNFSEWNPGAQCPMCGQHAREVTIQRVTGKTLTLAICPSDRRLWVYDSNDGVVHLIPVTNFYNELMMHKRVRDPEIALDSQHLFRDLSSYSDSDLTAAFIGYNTLRKKVELGAVAQTPVSRRSFFSKFFSALPKSRQRGLQP